MRSFSKTFTSVKVKIIMLKYNFGMGESHQYK